MLKRRNAPGTLPGWRDYERAVAYAFRGLAPETKWIYDVLLPDPLRDNWYYGVSCKMKEDLHKGKKGQVYIEVTNADGAIWDALNKSGLTKENHQSNPSKTGAILINLIEKWHRQAVEYDGRMVDTQNSIYLSLQYNRAMGEYQLFQYPIGLPDPASLTWKASARSIKATRDETVIFEYFGFSGSQVKFYPTVKEATWKSDIFKLEPLPPEASYGVLVKTAAYFPEKWNQATE
ncbi:MAG: hypothetical protein M9928_07540 [Anaerolineae bacterium]|nr:hypothetical protein [Anaerolineae bacterium]MCO5194710.1 hypothetical protein [Anaerolineae bacterium]MCO5204868.1 hypothetical protein [Anaerolineae bacterium]